VSHFVPSELRALRHRPPELETCPTASTTSTRKGLVGDLRRYFPAKRVRDGSTRYAKSVNSYLRGRLDLGLTSKPRLYCVASGRENDYFSPPKTWRAEEVGNLLVGKEREIFQTRRKRLSRRRRLTRRCTGSEPARYCTPKGPTLSRRRFAAGELQNVGRRKMRHLIRTACTTLIAILLVTFLLRHGAPWEKRTVSRW